MAKTIHAQTDRPPSVAGSQAGRLTHLQSVSEGNVVSGQQAPGLQRSQTTDTITSVLNDKHYAVLPHGVSLESWTAEEKAELDDHVRHMLHSRRSKMKRRWKAFGQYVRRRTYFQPLNLPYSSSCNCLASCYLECQFPYFVLFPLI